MYDLNSRIAFLPLGREFLGIESLALKDEDSPRINVEHSPLHTHVKYHELKIYDVDAPIFLLRNIHPYMCKNSPNDN